MTFFIEQPIRLGLVCLSVVLVVGVVWLQTRRPAAFKALVGVVLATIGLLAIERTVESDAEAVTALLQATAADLADNDQPAVLAHLATSADDLRTQIKSGMPLFHFDEVKITTTPEVKVTRSSIPPSATASFRVRAQATWRGTPTGPIFAMFDVHLVHEVEGWRIETAHYDTSDQGIGVGRRP